MVELASEKVPMSMGEDGVGMGAGGDCAVRCSIHHEMTSREPLGGV